MKVICNICGKQYIDYDSNSEKVWLYHECEVLDELCKSLKFKANITVIR